MPYSHYFKYRRGDKKDVPATFFICTTCTSGRPQANYSIAMTNSAAALAEAGVTFDYWLHTEDCHVDDARNFMVQQFMLSGAKYMIFIDDDVGWEPNALLRLMTVHDADIVGGAYPLRQPIEDYPVRIRTDLPVMQAREDGLLEVEGVPTGFMRIDRKVIEALSEKRKHLFFYGKEAHKDDPQLQVIFERMMVDGRRWSGDLNFCREARKLGFKVWVDPEMNFTHQGIQRWEGNLGKFLRKKKGILDPRLDAAMERLIAGDNSEETFKEIGKRYAEPYAMGHTAMKALYDACLDAKGPILEVGSGITTILAGIACLRNGQTVHSLEHDLEWFRIVRNYIQTWKVKSIALYYAPLIEYADPEGGDKPITWYGDGVLDNLPQNFDVVLIDGPPRRFGREAAYKLVGDRIKDATWIVDDTDDAEQFGLVKKYAEKYGKTVEDFVSAGDHFKRRHAIVK
jgi:hypothetical protein